MLTQEDARRNSDEARHVKEFDGYFVIKPEHPFWDISHYADGRPLPEGFRYTSADDHKWLTKDQLITMVKEMDEQPR